MDNKTMGIYIYKITNTINNKVYVGQTAKTIEERFNKHKILAKKKTNRYLYDAINHYSINNFKIEEIECCQTKEKADEREIYWISFYDSMNKEKGYNMQRGGIGGKQPDDILKIIGKKVSISNMGHSTSLETRNKISIALKGRPCPEERKVKISKTCLKKGIRPPVSPTKGKFGSLHHFFGKKQTPQAIEKMIRFRKGKTYEEIYGIETAQRLKNKKKKKMIGKNNPLYKEIDPLKIAKLLKEGKTIQEIEKILNISHPTIIEKFKKKFGMTPQEYKKRLINENKNKN